jgi:hypothetical protein
MPNTVLAFALCWLTLSAAGCATRRTVLVNERGDELTCETRGYGFIAALVAATELGECVKDAETRGYRIKTPSE